MNRVFSTCATLLLGVNLLPAQSLFINESSVGLSLHYEWPTPVTSIGQEFTARVSRADFVTVGNALPYQIAIHEGTLTGAVVGVSSNRITLSEAPNRNVYVFEPPVILSPGNRYVIEVIDTDFGHSFLTVASDAHAGRLFVNGEVLPDYDLDFSVGVFVPKILPDEAWDVIATEQQSVFVAPSAAFTNDYITDYYGATLTLSLGPEDELGTGSTLDDRMAMVRFTDPERPDSYYLQYEGRFVGVITETVLPRSITVTFTSSANAAAVQYAIRNLIFVNLAEAPPPRQRPISLTFNHPTGVSRLPLRLHITPQNDPPYSIWRFENVGHVRPTRAIVVPNNRLATVIVDGSESIDADTRFLEYTWNERIQDTLSVQPLLNQGVRVTNTFSHGVHWIGLHVTDGELQAQDYYVPFEVMTPHTAITRTLDLLGFWQVREDWQRRLRAPLRQAAIAMRQQRRGAARNFLKAFQSRAAAYEEIDPGIGIIFVESAQTIIDGLSP